MSHVTGWIDDVLTGRVLSEADDARFRAHLRTCAACRNRYDEGLSVLRAARGGGDAFAPGEAARLEARAARLVRPVPATPVFPWRLAFAGVTVAAAVAVTVTMLAWPRSPVGSVLLAGKGFLVDGAAATKDAVILAGAVLTTGKEDAAVLLGPVQGRRGLLLRPATRLRVGSERQVTLEQGRVRVQSKQPGEPFVVAAVGGRVEQAAPGTFVVERREKSTLVAVHQGSVRVIGRDGPVEVKEGQETELGAAGEVAAPRTASANALVEDRGTGTVWDAILRFLKQLIDAIARALSGG
jgi:ferric-dicitrate binding protein FerR (iron transport regulator)